MKILFLDVDGPLIPARMYYDGIPRRPFDGTWLYDPVAIGMVNALCNKYGAKIVYNSSHNDDGPAHMRAQATANDLDHHLHPTDWITKFPGDTDNRAQGITEWLLRHPEVTNWVDVDDFAVQVTNFALVDFKIGMTLDTYETMEKFLK